MSDTSTSPLLTFDEMRRLALSKLSEASDWLNTEWSDDGAIFGPSSRQVRAMGRAERFVSLAKAALDEAARRQEDWR